ncbi:MAG: 30S ribosomal protein S17 [Chlamydiota bacterium]
MEAKGKKKVKEGTVVAAKMDKTAVIGVETTILHRRYKKVVKHSKKYYAHHEQADLKKGQRVRIEETRPLSKLKRWIIVDVLS